MASKLAVQMYTLREHTKTAKDFTDSLKKISDIGYQAVQLSAVDAMKGDSLEVSPADAKKFLDDHGLRCIATHCQWDSLINHTEKEIEIHKTLDCNYIAIGGIKGTHPQTYEGYRQFIKEAQPLIEKLGTVDIRFGHHNHAFEFCRPEPGGKTLEDILIEEGGDDLALELDLYWVDHAGVNPVRIVERCHGRIPVIHLKDKEVHLEDGPRMAPIGEGNLDWDYIIPACETGGVQWYAVEQDNCYRDPFDCLKSSFEFLTSKGL